MNRYDFKTEQTDKLPDVKLINYYEWNSTYNSLYFIYIN